MKLFLLILTSILSIGLISWKDSTDISQNKDCIFRDILVGYVDYDNVLDSIYIEKTSEYRYDDNDGMKECFEQTERVIFTVHLEIREKRLCWKIKKFLIIHMPVIHLWLTISKKKV